MPIQAGAIAAGAAIGSAVGGPVSSLVGWVTSDTTAVWDVDKVESGYWAWYKNPILMPPAGAIIDAYARGVITQAGLFYGLRHHGIDWTPEVVPDGNSKAQPYLWTRIVQGSFTAPGVGDATAALVTGRATPEQWDRMVRRAGGDRALWAATIPTAYATPTASELVIALRSDYITPDDFELGLTRAGVQEEPWRGLYKRFQEWIPPPSNLISYAVRDALDRDDALKNRTYDEFPDSLRVWFRRNGMDYPLGITMPVSRGFPLGGTVERPITWADVEWSAHWHEISPTQTYRFQQLFRPGRVQRYVERGFEIEPWTIVDTRRALKLADYPPGVRDYLAAAAYNPIRLVEIKNAVSWALRDGRADGPGSHDWAIDQLLDRGLHPDDAEDTYLIWVFQQQEKERSAVRNLEKAITGQVYREVGAAYAEGVIDRAQAEGRLGALGVSEGAALAYLDLVESKQARTELRGAVRAVKADYLGGVLGEIELRGALLRLGLTERRADHLARLWRLERRTPHRETTSEQILRLLKEGIVTTEEARDRLARLGWSRPDALLFLEDASLQIAKRQATLLAAQERKRAAQERETASAIRRAEAQIRQLQSHLRTLTPVSTLQKWIKKGLIDPDWFHRRMALAGYPRDLADRYLAAAQPNGQAPPAGGDGDEGEGESPNP